MEIRFVGNWVEIVKRAWSFRYAIISAILGGIAAGLPMFDVPDAWVNTQAWGVILSQIGATVSALAAGLLRIVDQGIEKPKSDDDVPLGI